MRTVRVKNSTKRGGGAVKGVLRDLNAHLQNYLEELKAVSPPEQNRTNTNY